MTCYNKPDIESYKKGVDLFTVYSNTGVPCSDKNVL
jgi:hypothetical protein